MEGFGQKVGWKGSAGALEWVKITKTYADFSAAALTNEINIYSLPANKYIHDVKLIPTTSFSGGEIGTYTLSVGVDLVPQAYFLAGNVYPGNKLVSTLRTPIVGMQSTSVATDIKMTATSTVANLSSATAGVVDIYLLISTLP
jgi:hypothetical protein